jgi:hypothetical protein
MCLFYSSVLPLDIYILQQTVLTVPQQPVLPLDSSKSPAAYAACPWTRTGTAACATFGRACPTAAYAASGRVCLTAALAASGLVCSTTACAASGHVSLLWRTVLLLNVSLLCAFRGHVRVSVLQQSVMSSEVSGLQLYACASNAPICSTAANAVPRGLWPTVGR